MFGLLTAAVCVCLAQGSAESRKAAPATVSGKSLPDEAAGPSPKSHGLTPEKQMLQRAERRAQLQTELENLELDEKILELNQQKQKLHDQQRREQYQRQADLAKFDEKMQDINQERTRLQAEHRRQDQKSQEAIMEFDAKIQELSRQRQEISFKQRKKQIEQQLQALDGEGPAQNQRSFRFIWFPGSAWEPMSIRALPGRTAAQPSAGASHARHGLLLFHGHEGGEPPGTHSQAEPRNEDQFI